MFVLMKQSYYMPFDHVRQIDFMYKYLAKITSLFLQYIYIDFAVVNLQPC